MLRKFLPLMVFGGIVLVVGFGIVFQGLLERMLDWSFDGESGTRVEGVVDEPVIHSIREKLNEIEVGPFEFDGVAIEDAIELLRMRARENVGELPRRSGVGFVVRGRKIVKANGLDFEGKVENELINLSAGKIGLCDALDRICEAAGYRWEIDQEILKVVIQPKKVDTVKSEVLRMNSNDPFHGASEDEVMPRDDPFGQ